MFLGKQLATTLDGAIERAFTLARARTVRVATVLVRAEGVRTVLVATVLVRAAGVIHLFLKMDFSASVMILMYLSAFS